MNTHVVVSADKIAVLPPLAAAKVLIAGDVENRRMILDISASTRYHDGWAAIMFVVNLTFVLGLAIIGLSYSSKEKSSIGLSATDSNLFLQLIEIISILFVISTFFGAALLSILTAYPKQIINVMLIANVTFWLISFVSSLQMLSVTTFPALLSLLFAGLSTWYYYSVQYRVPFASSLLSTAAECMKLHYVGVIVCSYSVLLMQAVWLVCWSLAIHGINQFGEISFGFWAVMLMSLFWGMQTLQALCQTTVAGTVGTWCFQPLREAPVRGSFLRSITTSFGSICFGSLVVAVIHTVRQILNIARRRRQRRSGDDCENLFITCIEHILRWVEGAIVYFNKYAFCYVAAYGLDFMGSGKQVMDLFSRRGWSAVINDNLIGYAFIFAVLLSSAVTATAGLLLSPFVGKSLAATGIEHPALVLAVLGACLGAVVTSTITAAINSAVAMLFVCLADDASALQRNHPEAFDAISLSWQAAYYDVPMIPTATAAINHVPLAVASYLPHPPYRYPPTDHSHYAYSPLAGNDHSSGVPHVTLSAPPLHTEGISFNDNKNYPR